MTLEDTRRHVYAFLGALRDTGHDPENVKIVLREVAPPEMTSDEFIEYMHRRTAEICATRDSAIAHLQSAGILDSNGKLAEPYRTDTE